LILDPAVRRSPPGWRASPAAASYGRGPPSDRQLLAAVGAACGQHATSPGGLHPGAEAVLFCAMPLVGLIGLLHRTAGISPFGLGVRIPRKARERAWRHKSASARLPADYMNVTHRVSNHGAVTAPEGSPGRVGRPILPWSIRFGSGRSLAGAAGAVLFFGGPRRQTTPGPRPGGTVRTARLLRRRA